MNFVFYLVLCDTCAYKVNFTEAKERGSPGAVSLLYNWKSSFNQRSRPLLVIKEYKFKELSSIFRLFNTCLYVSSSAIVPSVGLHGVNASGRLAC